MSNNFTPIKSGHIKTGIASALALLVFVLGLYALVQGILQKRLVFVIESVVPLLLGGWALWVLVRYWIAVLKGRA